MRKILVFLTAVALVVGYTATPAVADWEPADGHKMHFPQLPNPNGWDIEIVSASHECADDWLCSETGAVKDIHFWTSWAEDDIGVIQWITVTIYDNIPDPDPGNPSTYSQPGNPLWGPRTFDQSQFSVISPYGYGDQGFWSPSGWQQHDHQQFQQINIENIENPFTQQDGQIYWLAIFALWEGTQAPVGWKTADVNAYPDPFTGSHYMDNAVWWDYINVMWHPLVDPLTQESLDLAFVITGEPPSEIPTLTEWGMIIFGLVLIGFITWVFLRRRKTAVSFQ